MKKGPHGKVPEVFILHALKAAAPMRNKPINKDIQGIFFLILWHFSENISGELSLPPPLVTP